jgi:hypothetical protein
MQFCGFAVLQFCGFEVLSLCRHALWSLRNSMFGVPCSVLFLCQTTPNKEHRIINNEDQLPT